MPAKEIIQTTKAPTAIGTYSQAVRAGQTVFISGQIPLDPSSGEMIDSDFEAQAHQVFKNLSAVAQAAGGSLADAVKLGVFLTNLNDFAKLNQIMDQYITAPYPARAAVQVSALPRAALIEIDAILVLQ